ncbi:hypothetical protein TBR22_A19070 [Luteitalea sp. TBR-22]|nr:hypothetical protein TBR22_A19070 [Luteitalea sp. TBR-22]
MKTRPRLTPWTGRSDGSAGEMLVEGRLQSAVAREMGRSRVTVKKCPPQVAWRAAQRAPTPRFAPLVSRYLIGPGFWRPAVHED